MKKLTIAEQIVDIQRIVYGQTTTVQEVEEKIKAKEENKDCE